MSNTPTPFPRVQLPAGLSLFRKDDGDSIYSFRQLSVKPADGFSLITDLDAPGGDIDVIRFGSESEVSLYQDGFEHAVPGDDVQHQQFEVELAGGEKGFFLIIIWGDSTDDSLNYTDRRATGPK